MTDKLYCPWCGAELEEDWYEYENGYGDTEHAKSGLLKCPDWDCRGYKLKLEPEIWQALISGKKAQRQLRTAKDRCVKKIKTKEREIANYLNGISVRDKEIQNLREQLQKTQEALKVATDALSKIDAFDCRWKGAMEIMAGMTSIANNALYEITSITKREE